jgi:O-antigen/teichoic acid export membrane protein
MNEISLKKIFNNVLIVLGAQLLILIISITRSLVLPSFLNVESYGYWQIYLFYSAYVGVFALGFNDGIYLRYGDKDYADLPFEKLRTSVRIFSLMVLLVTIVILILIFFLITNSNLRFTLIFSGLNVFVLGLTGIFTYVLQITNQLKKYSFFSVVDKVLVLITIALMFFVNNSNFKLIIIIDFLAKTIVIISMIYLCKELWIGKSTSFTVGFKEFKKNISVGVKLLLANLLGMLIIGIGRFLIQVFGGIEDFAIYSFGITITGLVLTAITAFSLVLYPSIKRLNENNYKKYFNSINSFVITFNFVILFLYFPAYWGVNSFYDKYTEMLPYLNLLFIIAILQSKMSILNNTFYKVLRKEKAMLAANLSAVLFFAVLAPIVFYFTKSIWSVAFTTFATMLLLCYVSEIYLKKIINIQFDYKFIIEIVFIIVFIITTTFMNIIYLAFFYILFLLIWVTLNISEWKKIVQILKNKL